MSENMSKDEIRKAMSSADSSLVEEVEAMDGDEIKVYLANAGVNPEDLHAKLHSRLLAANSRKRLDAARAARLLFEARDSGTGEHSDIRESDSPRPQTSGQGAYNILIGRLEGMDGQNSAAFFRRLENANDDDIEEMLRDLDELDEMDQ